MFLVGSIGIHIEKKICRPRCIHNEAKTNNKRNLPRKGVLSFWQRRCGQGACQRFGGQTKEMSPALCG